jgi:sulfur carrier protein
MNIVLNGESHRLATSCNLDQFITELELVGKRLAVELNEQIVPRSQFAETPLHDGDVIEIVHAIGGG